MSTNNSRSNSSNSSPKSFDDMAETRQLLAGERAKKKAESMPMYEAYLELCIKTNSPAQ